MVSSKFAKCSSANMLLKGIAKLTSRQSFIVYGTGMPQYFDYAYSDYVQDKTNVSVMIIDAEKSCGDYFPYTTIWLWVLYAKLC